MAFVEKSGTFDLLLLLMFNIG